MSCWRFLNAFEVLAIGHYWFGVPIRGSLWLIAGASLLFLLSSLGIGLLASTIANTQQEAMLTVWMTAAAQHFPGGFLLPTGGDAKSTAVDFICLPTALLPGDHPLADVERRRYISLYGRFNRPGNLRDCHHDPGSLTFSQAPRLMI